MILSLAACFPQQHSTPDKAGVPTAIPLPPGGPDDTGGPPIHDDTGRCDDTGDPTPPRCEDFFSDPLLCTQDGQVWFTALDGTVTDMRPVLTGTCDVAADWTSTESGVLTFCGGMHWVNLHLVHDMRVEGGTGERDEVVLHGVWTDSVIGLEREGLEVCVQDLTVSNGSAANGGGLYCKAERGYSVLNVVNVEIEDSRSPDVGGGVYTRSCNTRFEDVWIVENEARSGAGAALIEGEHSWSNVWVYGNTATHDRAGLYARDAVSIFRDVRVKSNTAPDIAGVGQWGGSLDWLGTGAHTAGIYDNVATGPAAVGGFQLDDPGVADFDNVGFGEGVDDNDGSDLRVGSESWEARAGAAIHCDAAGCVGDVE